MVNEKNTNTTTYTDHKLKLNTMWWVIVTILLISGIGVNYYLKEIALSLRLAGWVVLSIMAIAAMAQTREGKSLWVFSKEAKVELRKVVWPTRQETVQTTMLIAGMVVLMALIMWGIDSVLMWVIGWLTGTKG